MQNDTRIGVDIAKAVFEVAISDRPGRVERTARLRRGQVPGVLRPAACGDCRDGGVRVGPLLGPAD